MLWCHSHIELRLLEVEMNLSGNSLTLFRGQFDTFLNVDNFHFVRFVCFLTFSYFLLFELILSPFWALSRYYFGSRWSLIAFISENFGFPIFIGFFFGFLDVVFSLFGLYRANFGFEMGSEKFLGLCLYWQITLSLQAFLFSDF